MRSVKIASSLSKRVIFVVKQSSLMDMGCFSRDFMKPISSTTIFLKSFHLTRSFHGAKLILNMRHFQPKIFWKNYTTCSQRAFVFATRLVKQRSTPFALYSIRKYALVHLTDLKAMDLYQERLARQIGDGHRLIRGVAGSGKTLVLASHAKLLAKDHPEWNILVLCFNISLAQFIRNMIETSDIEVT